MIILMHIVVALGGVASATISYFMPTKTLFKTTVSLVGLTVISGTYLTIQNPSHLVQTCLSGLAYVAIVAAITVLARKKALQR